MPKKPRILCIDDRIENLRIRAMLLEQFGCETIAVQDHQSALKAVSDGNIDLLLIDYHLAGSQNGEDVARDVRVMRPEIPLVMLTGDYKLPKSACECVDAVLIKGSSDPVTLLDTIQKLLPNAELLRRRPMLVPEPTAKPA